MRINLNPTNFNPRSERAWCSESQHSIPFCPQYSPLTHTFTFIMHHFWYSYTYIHTYIHAYNLCILILIAHRSLLHTPLVQSWTKLAYPGGGNEHLFFLLLFVFSSSYVELFNTRIWWRQVQVILQGFWLCIESIGKRSRCVACRGHNFLLKFEIISYF